METVNKQLLEAMSQLDMAETKVINAKVMCVCEQADVDCNFALTAIGTARQAIAAAEQATSHWAGWQDFNDGFKAGAEEMRDGLLQLCKDFSDRQNRPYMGDVLAQVDSLFDLIVMEIPRSLERKAEQAQAEPVNQQQAGVYHKFNVSRADGRDMPGGDRHGAEYFVLDVTHDEFAIPALAAYAAACRNDYPALADDMVRRYGIAQQQAEPVALTNEQIEDLWWGELDNRSLGCIRNIIAAAQPPAVAVPDGYVLTKIPDEYAKTLVHGGWNQYADGWNACRAAMLAAAQQAASEKPDLMTQLRALAKQHGWNFVWAKARQIEEGTKTCHKCHGNGLTHSCRCVHYDKAKEQEAMAEYRAAAQKGGA